MPKSNLVPYPDSDEEDEKKVKRKRCVKKAPTIQEMHRRSFVNYKPKLRKAKKNSNKAIKTVKIINLFRSTCRGDITKTKMREELRNILKDNRKWHPRQKAVHERISRAFAAERKANIGKKFTKAEVKEIFRAAAQKK